MNIRRANLLCVLIASGGSVFTAARAAQEIKLTDGAADPHGSPRPARNAANVPLRTSIYFELERSKGAGAGVVSPESVAVSLEEQGQAPMPLLRPGEHFGDGVRGWLRPKEDLGGQKSLAVYLEPAGPLKASTKYTVAVSIGSATKPESLAPAGTWSFTTEPAPAVHPLDFSLDLKTEPVLWHGRFFSGICNVIFCTEAASYGPTFDLMAKARKEHPRAWSYQRDFWLTGTDDRPRPLLPVNPPNIVRERETRRIAAIESLDGKVLLRVEDIFGHRQYGIPDDRPVSDDYHPGDEVLIADGVHDARASVLAVDSLAQTVTVTPAETPPGGWKIAYDGPLPDREDPDAPGLFAAGGCYLRKFKPRGTACYYWGRLDKEWDLAVRRYGRRVMANFADAPGDVARDGRNWTTVKDLAQWHGIVREITGHIIDRYGADSLSFTWSIFNEPDLGPVFWRATWDELQSYYDYTTDAILRAFEDRGFASDKVFIGGLELGGIFGTNLRLKEFLAHCSPRALAQGALPQNAAFLDRRLDGKRSRRVEAICRDHAGKGSPCDFISVHAYNRSEVMAAKLIRAKEQALEIDPDYYRTLWVNSHESCPDWMPPPDQAAADAYLGNGYFPTWCLDVVHRQLLRAAGDPRYAYGETILTVWPPPANFAGINAVTRVIHVDDDGDGRGDRTVTIPMPIFHVLGLLSELGDRYWVLPERPAGGHKVSGFGSKDDHGIVRILLYTHHAQDTQSRSAASFDVTLTVDGLGGMEPVQIREYRIDQTHNSPFIQIRKVLDRSDSVEPDDQQAQAIISKALDSGDQAAQRDALQRVQKLRPNARQGVLPAIWRLAGQAQDRGLRELAQDTLKRLFGPATYAQADVEQIRKMCECKPTLITTRAREPDRKLHFTAQVSGNGCVFLTIEPDRSARSEKSGARSSAGQALLQTQAGAPNNEGAPSRRRLLRSDWQLILGPR
jgi:hypothetical protein